MKASRENIVNWKILNKWPFSSFFFKYIIENAQLESDGSIATEDSVAVIAKSVEIDDNKRHVI